MHTLHEMQHEEEQAVAQVHTIVLDLPRGTPGLNSKLLIGYSASHGQVGGCVS